MVAPPADPDGLRRAAALLEALHTRTVGGRWETTGLLASRPEVVARNADGTGDFKGLIEKLDYLEWLGVDCLWVPPFFTSPLRDGGYDVADYNNILPECGTVEDFHEFLDACHQRGIRVIIDFVMNHTSDQHPWFQASRNDPDGEYGDFYVWADDDTGYADARIIFVDTESSNWTFDPVRKQYFWHRFFSHQPDLNF